MKQESTEWDDILVKFGIKNSAKEEDKSAAAEVKGPVVDDEDEDRNDEDDEEVFRRYREMRISEMMTSVVTRPQFDEVEEIAGQDFVEKVTKAGPDVCVVLHLYKPGVVTCSLINQMLPLLASRFRTTKFLKSISTLCIANFPDENLPGLLIYRNGKCLKQIFGAHQFPANLQVEDLEWMLHKAKAIISEMEENPRKQNRREKGAKFFQTIDASDSSSDDECQ